MFLVICQGANFFMLRSNGTTAGTGKAIDTKRNVQSRVQRGPSGTNDMKGK